MKQHDGRRTGAPVRKSDAPTPLEGVCVPPCDVTRAAENERGLLGFSPEVRGQGADRQAGDAEGSGPPSLPHEVAAVKDERLHPPGGVGVASSDSAPSPPKQKSPQGAAQKASSGCGDNGAKGEGARKKLSQRQVEALERLFQMDPAGVPEHRAAIAQEFGVSQQQIATWFQNRRARERTRQLLRDFEALRETLVAMSDDNQRLRNEVQELRATHARCKLRAGLAVKQEPAAPPASARQSRPMQTPTPDTHNWPGRSYCPPGVKHKSMRAVSLLDPDHVSSSAEPSFRSPFDTSPPLSSGSDSHAAAPFAPRPSSPKTLGLPLRHDLSPHPAFLQLPPALTLFRSAPEPRRDVTLDEAFHGVLRHGPGLGSAGGLVFDTAVRTGATWPAAAVTVPASSAEFPGQSRAEFPGQSQARFPGQLNERRVGEWPGQGQGAMAAAAAPPWEGAPGRGEGKDLWPDMNSQLLAWYQWNRRRG